MFFGLRICQKELNFGGGEKSTKLQVGPEKIKPTIRVIFNQNLWEFFDFHSKTELSSFIFSDNFFDALGKVKGEK